MTARRRVSLPPPLADLRKALRRLVYQKLVAELASARPSVELTEAQRMARDCFKLNVAMASLPSPSPFQERFVHDDRQRLRPNLRSNMDHEDLRELAKALGASRMSAQYLDALAVVVGNQAHAERFGYVLELNVRTPVTTERTMRTILDQLKAAGVTFSKRVPLGCGRSQVVQCFGRARSPCSHDDGPRELLALYRQAEAEAPEAPPLRPPVPMRGIPEHLLGSHVLTTHCNGGHASNERLQGGRLNDTVIRGPY